MKLFKFSGLRMVITIVALCQATALTHANFAWFSRPTDTIGVSGQTVLSNKCTFEAVFYLPSSHHSGGMIFDEWVSGEESKYLAVSYGGIVCDAWPPDSHEFRITTGIRLDQWHHVAYVYDGAEERIYLDGTLLNTRAKTNMIGNANGMAQIGKRGGFVGFIDSVRVSNVARYTGLFTEFPAGDMTSDEDTLLLYNFNDPIGSLTVADESPLHRTGTLGQDYYYGDGTSPQIISKLPNEIPLGLKIYTAVEVEFSSSISGKYQVQTSLDMATWVDLPEVIIGDGNRISRLFSTQAGNNLFYRVVSKP